jgi:hypothetical protein
LLIFNNIPKKFLKNHNLPLIKLLTLHNIILQTQTNFKNRSENTMSKNSVVPEAREALNRFKMEAANEVGVNLKQGYNGDLTAKQAGSIGGQMVKKMIESYENSMK